MTNLSIRGVLTRVEDNKAVRLELASDILPESLEVGRAGDDCSVTTELLIVSDSLDIERVSYYRP